MAALASFAAAVLYCERGASPDVWAEPLNAATNVAYMAAAAMALGHLRAASLPQSSRPTLVALVAVAASIGIGSAAFHIAPSLLTKVADIVPIGAFVALALYVALTRVLLVTPAIAASALTALAASALAIAAVARAVGCDDASCLNGAPAYLPVLAALAATAIAARRRCLPGSKALLAATATFAIALAARTLDRTVCPLASFGSLVVTAHAVWHIATALTAYLVMIGLTRSLEGKPTS